MSLAESTSIFGMNLPYFIIILLFISYLIWLKYFNSRHDLKVTNVKELLMILNIFIFVFISIASILAVPMIGDGTGKLQLATINMDELSNMFSILATLIFIGVVLTLIRSSSYKTDLVASLIGMYITGSIMILVAYAYIFFILFESIFVLQTILFFVLIIAFGIMTYFISVTYYISWRNILTESTTPYIKSKMLKRFKISSTKFNNIKKNGHKIILITSIIFVIVVISLLHLTCITDTRQLSPEFTGYKIEQRTAYNYYTASAYQRIKLGAEITRHGLLKESYQKQFIFIKYQPYDIIVKDSIVSLIDNTNTTFKYNNQNKFTSYAGKEVVESGNVSYYINQHIMTLPYQSIDFKDIRYVYLETYYKINISENDYYYWNNFESSKKPCNNKECIFQINITNNLDKPVIVPEETIFRLNEYLGANINDSLQNISSCKLKLMHVRSNTYNIIEPFCENNQCYSEIKENKETIVSNIHFQLHDGVITNSEFSINKPMAMQIKLKVDCSEN